MDLKEITKNIKQGLYDLPKRKYKCEIVETCSVCNEYCGNFLKKVIPEIVHTKFCENCGAKLKVNYFKKNKCGTQKVVSEKDYKREITKYFKSVIRIQISLYADLDKCYSYGEKSFVNNEIRENDLSLLRLFGQIRQIILNFE